MRAKRSTPIESELAALADGSLEPDRREQILAQANSSTELRHALDEQRRAVRLTSGLDTRAPATLHARVEEIVAASSLRRPARSLAPRRIWLAGATAIAVTVAILAIALSGGGSVSQPVQQTAALTLSTATLPPPGESAAKRSELSASVDGVSFPYWRERFGWRSSGARSDSVAGRAVTTVFYSDAHGRRVGYAIVSGPAWTTQGGTVIWHGDTSYRVLDQHGATVVTWQRDGHLCVVAGRGVSAPTLLRLAGWSSAQPVVA